MDYEKKYNEALKRAKKLHENAVSCEDFTMEQYYEAIFPELAESEDERIRKDLIEMVSVRANCWDKDRFLAWIEKQKPVKVEDYNSIDPYFGEPIGKTALEAAKEEKADNANKVEPKFKKGEWIVWQNKCYKVTYNGCGYELIDQNGLSTSLEYGTVDSSAHLWTIQDAKDGDVLVTTHFNGHGIIIFIFKRITNDEMTCYCLYDSQMSDKLCFDACADSDYVGNVSGAEEEFVPATKEQRDLLFKKMHAAGYEWDADKKELKKIEQKPVDIEIPFGAKDSELCEATYYIPEGFHAEIEDDKVVIKKGEQKPAEETTVALKNPDAYRIGFADGEAHAIEKLNAQNPKWSEEDEKRINEICNDLNSALQNFKAGKNIRALHFEEIIKSNIDWLKAFRPQKQWKPTEEQINSVRWFLNNTRYNKHKEVLSGLLEQIKDL